MKQRVIDFFVSKGYFSLWLLTILTGGIIGDIMEGYAQFDILSYLYFLGYYILGVVLWMAISLMLPKENPQY